MPPSKRRATLSESPIGRLAVKPSVAAVDTAVPITSADDPLMPEYTSSVIWNRAEKYLRNAYS